MSRITDVWLKVFHHKQSAGYFLENEANNSTIDGKYSILSTITKDMKIEGYYEFRLEYPLNGYIYQWKQTENPMEIEEESLPIGSYSQVINPPSTGNWRGYLTKSSQQGCSLLDGFAGKDWWFSIGTIRCSDTFLATIRIVFRDLQEFVLKRLLFG